MRRTRATIALLALAACTPASQANRPASSTLVIGIDVSGSFRDSRLYDDAVEFAAHYIYAHLNGLGGLRVPTALFVGSVGGARPGEPKAFHPINDFQGRAVDQIAADIRTWFPPTDPYTDFNAFFQRVAGMVKERGLILAPLNIVVLSDGVPDATPGTRLAAGQDPYAGIDVAPLEFLSRSVTVRLLYASPTVGDNWKKQIRRKRVRLWTEEAQVMAGWRTQLKPDLPLEHQADLWKWVHDNVDFRVRSANLF
ncbi:MAG TPA: hypothetical protein VH833_08320 [Gemmatimonadales bacterium]|jgi:hypothetical protein